MRFLTNFGAKLFYKIIYWCCRGSAATQNRPKHHQEINFSKLILSKKTFKNLSFNGTDIFNVGPKVLIKYKTYYIIIGK